MELCSFIYQNLLLRSGNLVAVDDQSLSIKVRLVRKQRDSGGKGSAGSFQITFSQLLKEPFIRKQNKQNT